MHLKKTAPLIRGVTNVRWSRYWCPHPHCSCHVCTNHRYEVHGYHAEVICLAVYHKMKRIEHTIKNPGIKKKQETQDVKNLFSIF